METGQNNQKMAVWGQQQQQQLQQNNNNVV